MKNTYKKKSCIRSKNLKLKLASINNNQRHFIGPLFTNQEEKNYNNNFYGSFHKTLLHNTLGHLQNSDDYKNLVDCILNNKQSLLNNISLATKSTMKLIDPLASLSNVIIGKDQCCFFLKEPPSLCSPESAYEILELYAMALSKDVQFNDYNNNDIINKIISSFDNKLFNHQNIFRSNFVGDIGPYISQLLLFDVPIGTMKLEQKHNGVSYNNLEISSLQNGIITSSNPIKIINKFIYNGRTLSEAAHNDPVYVFYHNAALILQSLGIKINSGFPVFSNQNSFVTNGGGASILCALAEVCDLALNHCWYWKWQVYRKLRPEAYSIYINNIKTNKVNNESTYNISNIILNNKLLDDIKTYNKLSNNLEDCYLLPLSYIEGSPAHPSYPSGHATIAGACATIMKIYFNCELLWSELPNNKHGVLISNNDGTKLEKDNSSLYVYGEINKLATNISFGRNWAGIHYRSDAIEGMILGEEIAISYVQDKMSCWVQNNISGKIPEINFRKFNNSIYTIKPLV
jgi:membrane-associated phospholipid phosphatase